MKIIDSFVFLNEFDILKLRLAELSDYVDEFVLIESPYTFTNKEKPLHYRDNPITGYNIRHVIVEEPPPFILEGKAPADQEQAAFHNEGHQRLTGHHIASADLDQSDIMLCGDVDEIVRPNKIMQGDWNSIIVFEMFWYQNWINGWMGKVQLCTGRGRAREAQMYGLSICGARFSNGCDIIHDGGWHFSFSGGPQVVREKILASPHVQTHHLADEEKIQQKILASQDVCEGIVGARNSTLIPIDKTFPACVQQNPKEFINLIHPDYRP